METKRAKIFIVDDYLPMRQSLRKLLDLENDFAVCGEAGDVEQAYAGILASEPDVVVVDLVLGQQMGVELLNRLGSDRLAHLPILVLSMLPESLNAQTMLDKGARGYIMKSESPDQILTALRRVLNGQLYLSPEVTLQLTEKGYFRHE